MQKVRFLQDFQGVETRGAFYKKGQAVEVPSDVADRCVADGRAELVKEEWAEVVRDGNLVSAHDLSPVDQQAGPVIEVTLEYGGAKENVWSNVALPPKTDELKAHYAEVEKVLDVPPTETVTEDAPVMTTTTHATRNRHGKK